MSTALASFPRTAASASTSRCSGGSAPSASPITCSTPASGIRGRGVGDRSGQQQRVALREPGERRDQSVVLHGDAVGGQERRRVALVEPLQRQDRGLPLELVQELAARDPSLTRPAPDAGSARAPPGCGRATGRGSGRGAARRGRRRERRRSRPSRLASSPAAARRSATAGKRAKRSGSRPGTPGPRPATSMRRCRRARRAPTGHGHSGGAPPSDQHRPHPTAKPPAGPLGGVFAQSIVLPIPASPRTTSRRPSRPRLRARLGDQCQLLAPPDESEVSPDGTTDHHAHPTHDTVPWFGGFEHSARGRASGEAASSVGEARGSEEAEVDVLAGEHGAGERERVRLDGEVLGDGVDVAQPPLQRAARVERAAAAGGVRGVDDAAAAAGSTHVAVVAQPRPPPRA